jgi:hypothetical protein
LKPVNITQIDRWLVKPNPQLHAMTLEDKRMEDKLPQLEKKWYIFEAKDVIEPSKLVAQFVGRCVECIDRGQGSTSKDQ